MNIRDATFWTPRWSERRSEGGRNGSWMAKPTDATLTHVTCSVAARGILALEKLVHFVSIGFLMLFVVCKLFGIAVISKRL